jgi:hypothetical protein
MIRRIVENDTQALILQADNIVLNCRGNFCNLTPDTRDQIFNQLSTTAQHQAQELNIFLNQTANTSVSANNILVGYINLAANVSAAYIYSCGSLTTVSNTCVVQNDAVKKAQDDIINQAEPVAEAEFRNFSVYVILIVVGMLAFALFIIFIIIGLIRRPSVLPPPPPPPVSTSYPRQLNSINNNMVVSPVENPP